MLEPDLALTGKRKLLSAPLKASEDSSARIDRGSPLDFAFRYTQYGNEMEGGSQLGVCPDLGPGRTEQVRWLIEPLSIG